LTKGLLFAGSERFVNVSFDDGDHWQSLKLNMPMTSIRDLVIKDDDLVVGTHGRSFWIWMTSHTAAASQEGDEYSARVVQTSNRFAHPVGA